MTTRYTVAPHKIELVAELVAELVQGASGQNVNKVSSAIHLRFDVRDFGLPHVLKIRLLALHDRRVTRDGVIILKAQEYRAYLNFRFG